MPSVLARVSRLAFAAAFGLALAACGSGGGGPIEYDYGRATFDANLPKPHDYPVHGIDVSKYQGNVDWSAVANSGVKFAYIKATEGGDHADAYFQTNWQAAKAAGVPRGAYHFVYWCRSPLEEIRWFEQNVPADADALPPVLDVEPTPESKTCRRTLEPGQTVRDMRVMLEEMERYFGKKPIIYTSVDFYETILSGGALNDYPMWVRSTKHHPSVRYGAQPWAFWQYQADGHIPGIEGKVDRNVFHGTEAEWSEFLSKLEPK
jgi:lysozyme